MFKNQNSSGVVRSRRNHNFFKIFAVVVFALALHTVAAAQTGVLEICTELSGSGLENRIFRFEINKFQIVEVPAGQCSAQITVPAGQMTIAELSSGRTFLSDGTFGTFSDGFLVLDITATSFNPSEPSRLVSKNLPARTATVNVPPGDISNMTRLFFTNTFAAKAYVEICNRSVSATGAAEIASYTIDSLANNFSVQSGACTPPILVHIPSTPDATQATGTVRVTQISRTYTTLESASTIPEDRFNSLTLGLGIKNQANVNCANVADPVAAGCTFNNPRGGFADIDIIAGDATAATRVEFFNRGEPVRLLSICKIAGAGVAIGTPFTFDVIVNGEPGTTVPPVTVQAGDASSGGNCAFVRPPYDDTPFSNGVSSFRAGANVTVTERTADGFLVSAISSPSGGVPTVNLSDRKATMNLDVGGNVLSFTNVASTPISAATSAGTNVSVAPTTNLNLTFGNVSAAGDTTVTVIPNGQQPTVPSGFALSGSALVYEITTSAAFSGNIKVSFDVPNVADAATCSQLRILHYTSGAWDTSGNAVPQYNAAAKVCTVSQTVTSLSPFAVAQIVAPTAASVSIGGRVATPLGRGIGNAVITMTSASGNVRTTTTTASGHYRFDDVAAGETYIITAIGKRFTFDQPTRVMNANEDSDDINFIGQQAGKSRRLRVKIAKSFFSEFRQKYIRLS